MEICTVGGYEEVGKNMTAVKVGEDVVLIDGGLYLPGGIELQDQLDFQKYTEKALRRAGAIPNDQVLDKLGWSKKVKLIVVSHAHLDHVGGLPYIAQRYPNAEILSTPFTISVLKTLLEDEKISLPNKLRVAESNSIHPVPKSTSNLKVEFIHTTHSTIDSTFVVIHSNEGSLLYALDYKFDDTPTMGLPPNYEALKKVGQKGVKVAIINTLYASKKESNLSEKDADEMLKKAFLKTKGKNSALFITTFSSHIERLNNIVKHAKQTKREIVFIGRSLNKYVNCAIKIGRCPFQNEIKLLKYRNQINSFLRKVEADPGRYLVVCTGHQAEKNSILERISKGDTPFKFKTGDHLIFSSSVIPTEVNLEARKVLDAKLRKMGVQLQVDVHVHGHGSQESKKKLIELTKPEHIIPAHGNREQEKGLICVAKEYGYKLGETSHLVSNGEVMNL